MKGIIARKLGMTQVFDEQGRQIPVTALEVGPCQVVQRKATGTDGYSAVQLAFGDQKAHRMSKALAGHLKKAGSEGKRVLREIRVDDEAEVKVGDTITAAIFEGATHVDVIGTCKGRGFQGVVKRWKMAGGRASHGGKGERRQGSIGQCTMPSRVFKNKKMPGQMGHRRVTTQNLRLVAIRPEDNVILIEGSVPGPNGGVLMLRRALKK